MYNSTLSLTSAVMGGGWLATRPGRFTAEKETRYPGIGSWGGLRAGVYGRVKSHFTGLELI